MDIKVRQRESLHAVYLVEPTEAKLSILVAVVHFTGSKVVQQLVSKVLPTLPGDTLFDQPSTLSNIEVGGMLHQWCIRKQGSCCHTVHVFVAADDLRKIAQGFLP